MENFIGSSMEMEITTTNSTGIEEEYSIVIECKSQRQKIYRYLMEKYGEFEKVNNNSIPQIPHETFEHGKDLQICEFPYKGMFKIRIEDFYLILDVRYLDESSGITLCHNQAYGPYGDATRYSRLYLTFPVSKRKQIHDMLHEILVINDKKNGEINIYTNNEDCWMKNSSIKLESLNSDNLFLSKENHDNIDEIITNFMDEEEIEIKKRFGKTHKLNLIFCGIPGSGKTSMIKALAKRLRRNIYSLNLGNADTKNKDVIHLFKNIKEESILTIEDADAFFQQRESTNTQLQFSTFLNLLDGTLSVPNGLITIITANHPEKFDEAFMRAGRIDNIIRFGEMEYEQFERAHKAVLGENMEVDRRLYTLCINNKLSMSTLMDVLIRGRKKTVEERRELVVNAKKERTFTNDNSMYC